MSKIKLPHASGNSMSIGAPATNPASDLELKLPATIGTANQVLKNSSTPGTLEFGGVPSMLANSSSYEGLELQTPAGDGSGEFHIGIHDSGGTGGRNLVFKRGGADGMDTESMRIDNAGQLLIGTTSTPNGTSVYGSGFINEADSRKVLYMAVNSTGQKSLVRFHNGNGQVGTIQVNGSATSYVTSSDYRLKENQVAISDGITRVKTLKPYRFNFKADPTKTVDGFFAHEVTAVPEAITGEKDGTEMQGIDQSKLVPLLTAALQEAITKIETLETKVAALEAA